MSQQEINSIKMLLDFESAQTETISLEPARIDRALQLCSQTQNEERRWQTYLNALALFGFAQWLLDRAPETPLNYENCSIFQPQNEYTLDAVCNLSVGDFKLCLTAIGSLTVEKISLPVATVDSPKFFAHFYVLVEVQEELEQATIQGFMRYEQLIQYSRTNASANRDSAYQVPLSCFERDADLLLLYLRCLQSASSLPIAENELVTSNTVSNMVQLSRDVTRNISVQFVNVGLWLRDEIDEMARGLSWVLLPALAPDTAMHPLRSPTQELEAILTEVQRLGMQVPSEARGAYQDLLLHSPSPPLTKGGTGGVRVRLYAVVWPLLSPENVPEWKLLLVLGVPPGQHNLPYGTMMRVNDEKSILVERALTRDSAYIYACVAGTWDETFLVTISLIDGAALTLPPFAFRPGQIL